MASTRLNLSTKAIVHSYLSTQLKSKVLDIAFRGLGDNEFIFILIQTLIKYGFFESNPGTLLSSCIHPGNLEKKKISSQLLRV